jgi:hypothetical protein
MKAAEAAQPGDTVYVLEGVYRERVACPRGGTSGNPIVYLAESGKKVYIKGSDVWTPQWQTLDGNANVYYAKPDDAMFTDDKQIDGANPFRVPYVGINGGIAFTCGQMFFDGAKMREKGVRSDVESTAGTWFFDSTSGIIYAHFPESKKPSDGLVELTVRRRVFAPHIRGLGYITVKGFIIEHCGNQHPDIFFKIPENRQTGAIGTRAGNHWVIEDNVVRMPEGLCIDCGNEGGDIETPSQPRPSGVGHHAIRNNLFIDCGAAAMMAMGTDGCTITNNSFVRVNINKTRGPERGGIKMHMFYNGLIADNLFLDLDCIGVYLDNRFNGSRVTRNVIINSAGGIFIELNRSDKLLVDNNVIVNADVYGIYSHDAAGATYAHNLAANVNGTSPSSSIFAEAFLLRIASDRGGAYADHNRYYNNLNINTGRNANIPYPEGRCTDNLLDYNVWVKHGHVDTFFINASCGDTWFWHNWGGWVQWFYLQGIDCEQNSVHIQGNTATLSSDGNKINLNLYLNFDPAGVGSKTIANVTEDFLGNPIPQDGTALPGPFQNVKQGENNITLWTKGDKQFDLVQASIPNATFPARQASQKLRTRFIVLNGADSRSQKASLNSSAAVYTVRGERIGSKYRSRIAKGIYLLQR